MPVALERFGAGDRDAADIVRPAAGDGAVEVVEVAVGGDDGGLVGVGGVDGTGRAGGDEDGVGLARMEEVVTEGEQVAGLAV